MEKLKWHTEERVINDLVPFDKNPRKMTEDQAKQLTRSLEKFNLVEIPAIDKDDVILAGHQRLKVMQLLGRGSEKIDVRVPNRKLTDDEFREYNVRSNKNTGMWDDELLASLFTEEELRDIGFTEAELGMLDFGLENKDEKEDEVPAIPDQAISEYGDIYELGPHRVMCGDATKKEDLEKLMRGEKADMVFTDPPYNVDYSGQGENTSNTILNDKMSDEAFDEFLKETFLRYSENSKSGAGWYIFHSSSTQQQFQKAIDNTGWKVKNQIIWNKPVASMGWGDYRWKHEPMFYCGKENTQFYGDRTNTTVLDFPSDDYKALAWLKKQKDAESKGYTTIWSMKRDNVNEYLHPTQKPVELIVYALINNSKGDDVVLDLFLGSGATLIACQKKQRRCYGLELDPKYVDVIVSRYCEYTGNYKIKKNGVEIEWNQAILDEF